MSSDDSTRINVRLVLKESAAKELGRLSGDARKKALAQLVKIRDNPMVGAPLGNKAGANLTGYRKIYFDGTRKRVVWRVEGDRLIVVVMAIGNRDKGAVYKTILARIHEKEVGP